MDLKNKVRDLLARRNTNLQEDKRAYNLLVEEADINGWHADQDNAANASEIKALHSSLEEASSAIKALQKARAKLDKLVAYEKRTA